MPSHLRIKRHLRVLENDGTSRFIRTLDEGVDVPSGDVLNALLSSVEDAPPVEVVQQRLCDSLDLGIDHAALYVQKMLACGILESFDPYDGKSDRFDRQLLFFDSLDPVMDDADNQIRQRALEAADVLVLGLGGIGHQVALSLAAAGVGALTLVDGDRVEASNLHRQILFAHNDVGRSKVDAARDGLLRIAPHCRIRVVEVMIGSPADWGTVISNCPDVRYVFLSADKPVQLVNWLSAARIGSNYHFIKCGYMGAQGLIGPLLGPATKGYEELFDSWAPSIAAQSELVQRVNAKAVAPTMAASNAIMANIAALDLVKHITRTGTPQLLERRLLLDLRDYSTQFG